MKAIREKDVQDPDAFTDASYEQDIEKDVQDHDASYEHDIFLKQKGELAGLCAFYLSLESIHRQALDQLLTSDI